MHFIFLSSKITVDSDWSHDIKRCLLLGGKAMTNLVSIVQSRDVTLSQGLYSQSYGFPSSHVWMWELNHKEGWAPKNWCFWTVALEKTFESPLDSKEIEPVNPKGTQSWIFIGRTDAEAPILWPPDVKCWLIRKDPVAGKVRKQEEKGMREDEMVGWHHWLNGHEFEQAPGDGEGRRSLACCSPCGHKKLEKSAWTTTFLKLSFLFCEMRKQKNIVPGTQSKPWIYVSQVKQNHKAWQPFFC